MMSVCHTSTLRCSGVEALAEQRHILLHVGSDPVLREGRGVRGKFANRKV